MRLKVTLIHRTGGTKTIVDEQEAVRERVRRVSEELHRGAYVWATLPAPLDGYTLSPGWDKGLEGAEEVRRLAQSESA
jgi:hypothetical protein